MSAGKPRNRTETALEGVATASKPHRARYCQRVGCKNPLATDSRADAKFCSAACRWQNYAGTHVTLSIADLCAEFGDDAMDRMQRRNAS